MNNDEFLKRLSEVSEWHRPQTGPSGAASVNKRTQAKRSALHPGNITQAQLDLMTDEEAQDYYDRLVAWREAQPNPSVPPQIKRLKIAAVDCEDCGRHCPNGRRVESKVCTTGQPHWRTQCHECELYRDPATGEFTLPQHTVHNYMTSYYRPKLGVYNSKHQRSNVKSEAKPKTQSNVKKLIQGDPGFQMVRYETDDNITWVREPISRD